MNNFSEKLEALTQELDGVIVGQKNLKRDMLIALLSGGHVLLEGAPGLAKTKTISTLSQCLELTFSRIQFTPDLLPSDLTGARIYNPDTKEFFIKKGPVFTHFLLADEINRAPSKVQSALLEVMEEGQITIGDETFQLEDPFVVLATQNPLEQEGTFPLPEAQLDRFLLKSIVEYPSKEEEQKILENMLQRERYKTQKILNRDDILSMKKAIDSIEVSKSIFEYISNIVCETRDTQKYPEIEYGSSPRASIALLKSSKVLAFLEGREYVLPEDVKEMATAVLRHRIILSFDAMAHDVQSEDLIQRILSNVVIK